LLPLVSGAPGRAATDALPADGEERLALAALEQGHYVRARELAGGILAARPDSVPALYALAVALHDGEGNVPLALRWLRRARALVETEDGRVLPGREGWHEEILWREVQALSDLGLNEELIAAYRRFRDEYGWDTDSFEVWPLMKLGRIDEARAAAARAIAGGEAIDVLVARNGLCAMDGYPACLEMLETARTVYRVPSLSLSNAALAAMEVGRYEEAESYLLEAVRDPDPYANPWRQLVTVYLTEGRLGEAAAAAREMMTLARRLPPRMSQHQQAQNLVTAAELLLAAGHPERALAASRRALMRPDRTSHLSGTDAELRAENALLDRRIHVELAQRAREAAGLAAVRRRPLLWLDGLRHRTLAWASGRRVRPLLLAGGLRPVLTLTEAPGPQLDVPDWLYPDAIELFGAGPALTLLGELAADPPPAERMPQDVWNGRLAALAAEASWLRGDTEGCLEQGRRARRLLPRAEMLLRTRVAARMADALRRAGRLDHEAVALYDEVLASDPGLLRRLALPLPVGVAGADDGSPAGRAVRLALASPRFVAWPASPFVLAAYGDRACLAGPGGAQLACAARTDGGPDIETGTALLGVGPDDPRLLAWRLLLAAFAPRLDLSQTDLATLDGTPVVERGLDEAVADELLGPPSADR
ncbi:MAG: hypothetical protein D6738_01345, partial [Acidobacteria bacterium]